jgi:hypothetical protein
LTSDEQTVLIFTALFHDAAKPLTSEVDPETGRITSPKHAVKGEHLTRGIPRDLGCDLATREQIARLVRNDHARFLFFQQREPNLHYVPHEAFACRVTVLSGPPGSGKDTWLSRNRSDLPVISLDDIRGDLDVEPTDTQDDDGPQSRLHLRTPGASDRTVPVRRLCHVCRVVYEAQRY